MTSSRRYHRIACSLISSLVVVAVSTLTAGVSGFITHHTRLEKARSINRYLFHYFNDNHRIFPTSSISSSTEPARTTITTTCLQLSTLETAGVVLAVTVGGLWIYIESAPTRVLQRQRRRQNSGEQQRIDEWKEQRRRLAYIEPKEYWKESELKQYDGTNPNNEDGPILFAADGIVFNVWKGRNFYGPGGEYHIFAGRDATRLLARTLVEEETSEDAVKPLTIAERAALAGWIWTFKQKYDIVGKLEGFDESMTKM